MPNAAQEITIVGGGISGLCLGIFLRRLGVPVVVHEAGGYPRHKVCGEFFSPRNPRLLEQVGLMNMFNDARLCTSVLWCWPGSSAKFRLRHPALALSRYVLDRRFAEEFVRLGGVLNCASRVPADEYGAEEGRVIASGRALCGESKYLGLKCHFLGLRLEADLEMHVGSGAYVGMCAVENNRVNVSGLFSARRLPCGGSRGFLDLLNHHGLCRLASRLQEAQPDEDSLCGVTHLRFHAQSKDCFLRLGDAYSVIPPLTGNGMSLAVESAWMAAPALRDFSFGMRSWKDVVSAIQREIRCRFHRRLRVASLVQKLIFSPELLSLVDQTAVGKIIPWRVLHRVTG